MAGLAALAYAGRSGLSARLLLPGIVTLFAFGAWAIVQLEPSITGAPLVNDLAIAQFILDLALILGRTEPSSAATGARDYPAAAWSTSPTAISSPDPSSTRPGAWTIVPRDRAIDAD